METTQPLFFPCPEAHVDSGRIEAIIKAARVRLALGMSNEEVHADLISPGQVGCNIDVGQVYLAIIAAKLLGSPYQ